jgi:hypothetical protein
MPVVLGGAAAAAAAAAAVAAAVARHGRPDAHQPATAAMYEVQWRRWGVVLDERDYATDAVVPPEKLRPRETAAATSDSGPRGEGAEGAMIAAATPTAAAARDDDAPSAAAAADGTSGAVDAVAAVPSSSSSPPRRARRRPRPVDGRRGALGDDGGDDDDEDSDGGGGGDGAVAPAPPPLELEWLWPPWKDGYSTEVSEVQHTYNNPYSLVEPHAATRGSHQANPRVPALRLLHHSA